MIVFFKISKLEKVVCSVISLFREGNDVEPMKNIRSWVHVYYRSVDAKVHLLRMRTVWIRDTIFCDLVCRPTDRQVNVVMVKCISKEISIPLSHIFNLSLESGIFLEKLKRSRVIPIFKSGSKLECNNYRPISLLCSISNCCGASPFDMVTVPVPCSHLLLRF